MSVVIVAVMKGDADQFNHALTDHAADFDRWSAEARRLGAQRHQFGLGLGEIVITDVWESEDGFTEFMNNPELMAFLARIGMDKDVKPDVRIYQATPHTAF